MTAPADRWRELERLFNEALAFEPDARVAWLKEACTDETLRAEVERLLVAESGAEDRLRGVLAGATSTTSDESATRVGAYRLIRELDRGGMGSVWLAERADAEYVDHVAIKLIRPDAASPGLIRRFLSERQILANLKHPNIARLLDGGTTEDGRPYLVMEYIEGEPITAYADRQRLGVAGRIALVRQVCDALQFAHANLVVHRDIKPANILVTAEGVPKLLDFGIAKILDPDAMPHRVAATVTGVRLMTPAYASPEQIRGESVTTASDVYSLGVVLYELLTGRLPYRVDGDQPHDLARAILEAQPERPSVAVTGAPIQQPRVAADSGQTETTAPSPQVARVAQARGVTVQRLRRQLTGDIDNILLVALRKEPERRYASVEQLAADLRRHQEGHPVVARPDTWTYRAGKFVGRNRGAVAAGTSAFITLAFFAISLAVQAARIARERDVANREREKAERVTEFLVDVFDAADPNNALGVDVTAREILAEGGRQAQTELADQPEVQAAAMEAIGKVYSALGEYDSAATFLHAAHDLRLATLGPGSLDYATSLAELGLLARVLNRYDSAATYHTRAIDIRRRVLGERHTSVAGSLNALGVVEQDRENLERAESLYIAALDMFTELAGRDHVETLRVMRNLGDLYNTMGRYGDAITTQEEALTLTRRLFTRDHMDVAYALNNLGSAYEFDGQYDKAEPLYLESLAMRQRLLPEDHSSILIVKNNLGGLRLRSGDYAGAAAILQEIVDARRRRPAGEVALATPLSNLAVAWVRLGRLEDAIAASREATRLVARALGPRSVSITFAMNTTAGALNRLGRYDEAERVYREIVDIRREAYGEDGHPNLVFSVEAFAWFLLDRKRPAQALPLADEAVAIGRRVFRQAHPYMAESLLAAGRARVETGRYAEAIPLLHESLEQRETTGPGQPSTAQAQSLLGRSLIETGKADEALPLLRSALEYLEANAPPDGPWLIATREALARAPR